MEPLIYDEAASLSLHRWLAFLRVLMSVHPRVGASQYALNQGAPGDYAEGWNAVTVAPGGEVSVRYVRIEAGKGLTTETRPDVPDDQIHKVSETNLPLFESTQACRQVTRLAELVAFQRPGSIEPAWVQARMDDLRTAASAPLRGMDAGVEQRIGQALARVFELGNGPDASLAAFRDPIEEVVRDYLSFRITRRQASNIHAVLLVQFATRFPSLLDRTGRIAILKAQVDHLIGVASTITNERHRFDLGSFSQLTYLALMWGETATIMAKQLATQPVDEALKRWFGRRALYVEENSVHELEPTLMHPTSYMPFGVPEFIRSRSAGIANRHGLYAGAGEPVEGPFDPKLTWERLSAYSATAERLGSDLGPFREFFAAPMAEHLSTVVLTMKVGRSRA